MNSRDKSLSAEIPATHAVRGTIRNDCDVCGALPGRPCTVASMFANARQVREAVPLTDDQLQAQDMPAWLEWQALSAIQHLRRIDPEHWLVKAVRESMPAIRDERTAGLFSAAEVKS